MPATDCAADITLSHLETSHVPVEDAQLEIQTARPQGLSRALKALLIAFAGTTTVALGLAIWYLGNRIAAPGNGAPSIATAATFPAIAAPWNASLANSQNAARLALSPWPVDAFAPIERSAGYVPPVNLYLAIAGLGIKPDNGMANSLRARGYRAQVQMRDGATTRILIGPFSTQLEREQAERTLRWTGILTVETPF
jgi:hypothetical protein